MIETTLSLFGFAKDVIGWVVKFVQPKIDVKPKKLHLNVTDWKKQSYFVVCNKTDKPLFDTQILIWLPADLDSSPPIKITQIEDQNRDDDLTVGDIAINSGALIVNGNANNKGVMLLQLQYLPPQGCKRVFFSAEQQIEGDISFQAVSTSKDPPQNLSGENKVGIPFTPPIAITLSSMSFFIKKTQ